MKRVVVGLSGGVDSSVTAHLLLEQGYEVVGIFMRNWHDESVVINNDCPWIDDSNDAMLVASHLGIPFQVIDLSKEYKERIVDYMFSEYENGRTPNPDVLCNREIKFDVFMDAAMQIGADYVATGHYCRKDTIEKDGENVYRLLAGKDGNKDQSYFLCQLTQDQLSKALFPIGELTKPEVREIAHEIGLPTADKKDSQGLCFVGKVKLPVFLQQQLAPKEGEIIEIAPTSPVIAEEVIVSNGSKPVIEETRAFSFKPEDGEIVGKHNGAHYYTIGQRKGLNVGGKEKPLFVLGTNTNTNTVYVGQGDDHAGLYRSALFIPNKDLHWIREDLRMTPGSSWKVQGRIRYRQPLVNCELFMEDEGMFVRFEHPQRGIAEGQFFAWYADDELIGSGVM